MADRIDKYFSDYYSGVIDMQIKLRKDELKLTVIIDKNIGRGKTEHKRSFPFENRMIIEKSDYPLQSFIRDKEFMNSFLKMLIDEERALLVLRYDRRRKRSWVQVTKMLNKSEVNVTETWNILKILIKTPYFMETVDNFCVTYVMGYRTLKRHYTRL
ncbi:Putative transcriptional activator-phage associated [Leuconostoc citreum]|nr:Putative transcriptional activator-phage associated [Leuconostoc citreum]